MSITRKIEARVAERISSQLGYRSDIYLADYQPINANVAKVVLAFERTMGAPVGDDIRNYFLKSFDGKILPKMETARIHLDEGGISVVAETFRLTRPLEDAKSTEFAAIVANVRYVDTVMNETWDVTEGTNGEKFLARVCAEEIGDILQERRRRMEIKATPAHLTVANILSVGNHLLSVGDLVKVMVDNHVVSGAEITSVASNGDVKVKTAQGAFYLPKEAVLELQQKSKEDKGKDDAKVKQYFSEIYGPGFAKELVR